MIIFLDFDGVLHPDAVYSPPNKPLELRAPGELFMHAPILEKSLAYYPEAKIVLSTSWVQALGYDRTLKKMPVRLRERVISATYHKHMRHAGGYDPFNNLSRYQQISSHVKRNGIKKWIAIDDLFSGQEVGQWPTEHLNKLVLTEESKGLGSEDVQAELNTKLMEIQY